MAFLGFLKTNVTHSGGVLTEEEFFAAMKAAYNARPHPCRLGQHIVSRAEKERGYGICGSCGALVGNWPRWT